MRNNTAKKFINKAVRRFQEPIAQRIETLEFQLKQLQEIVTKHEKNTGERETYFYNALRKQISNEGFIKISQEEVLTKIFSGAKFYLDPRDIGLVPHLILDKEWEHEITLGWLSMVRPGDTVLDIGANFGYFGVLAAQQANRNCKVILFEANPKLITYLNKTVMVNSLGEVVKIENLAVSNKKGIVHLNILKDYIASSSLHAVSKLNEYNQNGARFLLDNTVKVPATTIDVYCHENNIKQVDLIKMDIEGHEDRAYEGMKDTIKTSPHITMFVEFTKGGYDNPEKFYNQMLEDFGSVYLINGEGKLTLPKDKSYAGVIGNSAEWVMPVFSKRKDLENIK